MKLIELTYQERRALLKAIDIASRFVNKEGHIIIMDDYGNAVLGFMVPKP